MATKFKVGDKVVGNAKASKEYSITRKGWVGTVTAVGVRGNISVKGKGILGSTGVLASCFDKVTPAPKTKSYSVDEAFILEGYKAAGSEMRAKLKKKFPEVFKPKEIEFKDGFKTNVDVSSSNEAFYIGRGHAPSGLTDKCLILQDGVKVSVKKSGSKSILVFTKEI